MSDFKFVDHIDPLARKRLLTPDGKGAVVKEEFLEHVIRQAYNKGLSTAYRLAGEVGGELSDTLLCGLESSKYDERKPESN